MKELKRCPLCGGKAEAWEIEEDKYALVGCTKCDLEYAAFGKTGKKAAKKAAKHWNMRAREIMVTLPPRPTVTLTDGRVVEFDVTDEGEDWIRLDSRDCIGTCAWNEENQTEGGYPQSKIREHVDSLWELLPKDTRVRIIPTKRKFLVDGEVIKEKVKLFLPSAAEIFDEDSCYGDEGLYKQMDYYKDRRNRMKAGAHGEDTTWYWTQSVSSGNSTHSCGVYYYGHAYSYYASLAYGVPLCFRIKKRILQSRNQAALCRTLTRKENENE